MPALLRVAIIGAMMLKAQSGLTATLSESGKAELARYSNDAVARGLTPGVVTVVLDRSGALYENAAGKQDVARNTELYPNAIFRIASMTKPITSVALLMLMEEGKVALDDPVSKYLPEFNNRAVIDTFNKADASVTTRPAKRPITLRHLLAHTSGLGYSFSDPTVLALANATKKADPELPLLHDPGDKWTYSAATRVAGFVVEKVSGQTIDVFLRQRIFEPLKMTDTAHSVPADKVSRVITVHSRKGGKLVEAPNDAKQESPVRGDGGLYSTARDYTRFLQMLLNGGSLDGAKILSPKTVALMGQNHIGDIFISTQPAALPERTKPFPIGAGKDKFGLGFQIQAADPALAKFRSPGSLSWAGINNTHFWIDPKRGVAAIVLMQVLPFYDDDAIKVLRDIEEIVYRSLK
jgi:CubicO group peptidase (beta-lactamase class C family)